VKNLGDGLMVVFDGTAAAVGAAVAMQQAIAGRPASAEPLSVKIGIATGDAEAEDGDYFGLPVGVRLRRARRPRRTRTSLLILATEMVCSARSFALSPAGYTQLAPPRRPCSRSPFRRQCEGRGSKTVRLARVVRRDHADEGQRGAENSGDDVVEALEREDRKDASQHRSFVGPCGGSSGTLPALRGRGRDACCSRRNAARADATIMKTLDVGQMGEPSSDR